MDGHFCAFSFVDRIGEIQRGRAARGRYTIPAGLPAFPTSLVAESVGQLAAWVGMHATDFQRRPVAGLVGRIEIPSEAQPGQTLELAVDIDDVDQEAISYRGAACVAGSVIVRLESCVGPMLPADEFDDPVALRSRFEMLCGNGAPSGMFSGVEMLSFAMTDGESGAPHAARLQVPASALFFSDHFPRRPVLPGTLLLDAMFRFGHAIGQRISPRDGSDVWSVREASGVKLRTFIAPGEALDLQAALHRQGPESLSLRLSARMADRSAAGARLTLASGGRQ